MPDPQPTLASPVTPTHFESGSTLAGRYRIITILGRGGMGEVYRADDLTLGVSVALKFLPPSLALDPLRLEHFRSEVRLARQVSHPNVCRVYDIGQTEGPGGRVFLSMEYVDGEDLASLLRRIGRLPSDKAVQIARQLCFGLAAAHEPGIIHRDLKPANIMLDGRGQARIMDFGIAGVDAQIRAPGGGGSPAAPIAGTPGYMSPEQLSGGEVSKRSDIYSLGVLLYELFTGRAAFSATAVEELRTQQSDATRLTRPSTFIADIDPAVERIILQCLEPDPKDRPASAMSIAAALPGGDPLAAALAAGETPSPELIAASGPSGVLTARQAWTRIAVIVAMLSAVALFTASKTLVSRVKPAKSTAVLADRAAEIVRALGYTDAPADAASDLSLRSGFVSSVNRDRSVTDKAARLAARPGSYEFWYRRSPAPIQPDAVDGSVQYTSPFPHVPGEVLVRTDASGRLENFLALPARTRRPAEAEVPDSAIDRLFEFAELDRTRFTTITPTVRSAIPTENVQAWSGSLAEFPDLPIRVHVGLIEGRINTFYVQYTFPQPPAPARAEPSAFARWASTALRQAMTHGAPAVLVAILLGTSFLAWKNIRSSRGDRTTAFRLSVAMFFLTGAALVFAAHRPPTARALFFNGEGIGPAVFTAVQFWLFYTALEPYARRVYPHALVSWTRIARGQFGDPIVGRHILTGMLIGSISVFCTILVALGIREVSDDSLAISIYGRSGTFIAGPDGVVSSIASSIVMSIMVGAGTMLPLVVGQLAFKRRWVGYIILVIVLCAVNGQGLLNNPVDASVGVAVGLIPVLAIRPGGLLALVTTHLTIFLALYLAVGFDYSHWFIVPVWIPIVLLVAMLAVAFRAATGRARAA